MKLTQDRIVNNAGVTTRKDEVDKFIIEATNFILNTDSSIKKIDELSLKYSVTTTGELRGEGKGTEEINSGITSLGEKIKKNLDIILEEYTKIETTSIRITSRVEELGLLTKLSNSYKELITQNSTTSSEFASKLSKIKMEQSTQIPSIMKKRVEEVNEDVKKAIEGGAPKLLTPKEIEKIIKDKYGDSMTPEQIKLLAETIFKNCNSLEITTKNMKYEVTITKDGKYIINGVESSKSDVDILFGKVKFSDKNKKGDINADVTIASRKNGKTSIGNKDFGTVEYGFERGVEVVMAQFLQNGIPLIESADGKIQMIKNTQVDLIKGYITGGANANVQGVTAGVDFSAKIGVDVVNVRTDIISVRIPWTDKNIIIKGNAGVGAKAGASGEITKHKQKVSVEGGVGATGKIDAEIVDQDFKTETTKDFIF
jgi:hypothetical protein